MPITFNSEGGFLNGTISSSGNNIFIQTSGSAGIVHLDGDKVLLQSQSAGNKITASLKIDNENLVINDNLRVKRNEFRFKSADRAKEVKIDVSADGDIRFKDNDNREIVKFREGGKIDLGQNDTANSQSVTNWNGAISASGFIKCKNTFLGRNIGFGNNFILAHSDRVKDESSDILAAGYGFAFGQNPAGHTYINAGDGTFGGYESINFYQAGLPSSILGKNRNWQLGAGDGTVQFEPPEKLTVQGNISASGNLIIQGSISASSINTTIVSSSIVFSSGSNIFGDAITDTHTFNGHITASGNISASGDIESDGTIIGDGLNINGTTTFNDGDITNVGVIDADTIRGDGATNVQIGLGVAGINFIAEDGDKFMFNEGENNVDFLYYNSDEANFVYFDASTSKVGIGDNISQTPAKTLTVKGDISASGDYFSPKFSSIDGHITASGNISASGTSHTFGGLVTIRASADNQDLFKIQDVDNENNLSFKVDSNQHGDFQLDRNSVDKVRFNTYWPTQIDNDSYETFGGLILGSDADRGDKTGFGLYVSAGPDSGSIYTKERVFIGVGGATGSNDMLSVGGNITATSHITASGNISSSGTGSFTGGGVFGSNVGIGTTSPTSELHIKTSSPFPSLLLESQGASANIMRFTTTDGTFTVGQDYDDNFSIANASNITSNRVFTILKSGGNVGIGTTSPNEKLTVFGNIDTSGSAGHITASGNISSSGTITADRVDVTNSAGIYADKIRRYSDSDTTTKIVLNDEIIKVHAGHSSNESINVQLNEVTITPSITASGNISSSGTITGNSLVGTLGTSAQTNITSVGALNAGSITSGFGNIDIGSSTFTTTGNIYSTNLFQLNNGGVKMADQGTTTYRNVLTKDTNNLISIGNLTNPLTIKGSGGVSFTGNITASGDISSSGVGTFNSLDIASNIDVDGTANLDIVDVDGAATFQSRTVFEIGTFTDGDTTPDVRPSTIYKTANTSATTITGFDNGTEGQIIHVLIQDTNTDFTNGTNLKLFRGLDATSLTTNDIISFVCFNGTIWMELNRQDNS